MAKKTSKSKRAERNSDGYPPYPKKDDVYSRYKEDENVDPANPTRKKERNEDPDNKLRGEQPVDHFRMGTDLDVPGSELDDAQEEIGSEDEENNYYSLGGEKDLEDERDDS